MALPAGKDQWVTSMLAIDQAFMASFGGVISAPALTSLKAKYEAQYDALVFAITTNAVVTPPAIT